VDEVEQHIEDLKDKSYDQDLRIYDRSEVEQMDRDELLGMVHRGDGLRLTGSLEGSSISFDAATSPVINNTYYTDTYQETLATIPDEVLAEVLLGRIFGWEGEPDHHRADTPTRYVKALREMADKEEFKFTTFPAKSDDMVTQGPIPFFTLCAHHVVPFYGRAWVAYVPDGKIVGLSKLTRLVQQCAKGLHVQEELTPEIADELEGRLEPRGVAVVIEAEHLCMAMRGVKQPGVFTNTAVMRGVFGDHERTAKAEFLSWVKGTK
jgi:GTP cyclohydrolase IA